jgi:hypothetical protein
MKKAAVAVVLAFIIGGCSSSVVKSPTSTDMYPYRAMNDDCSCERFTTVDPKVPVRYEFSAAYKVDKNITTEITVVVHNGTQDTLDMSSGAIRVSSRNVQYRYNHKFGPVTITAVPPNEERTLTLVGSGSAGGASDPWLPIAGEEMTLTLKGLRIRGRQLATQTIQFVPSNPKFTEQR